MTASREEELITIISDNVKELVNEHGYESSHVIGVVECAVAEQRAVFRLLTKCDKCNSSNTRNHLGLFRGMTLRIKICMDCNSVDIERFD